MGGDFRIDLTDVGWEDVDSMHLGHYREQKRAIVNTIMKLRVP